MKDLRLIEINTELQQALADEPALFESRHDLEFGLNAEFVPEIVAQTMEYYAQSGVRPPWGGFLAVDNETRHVFGTCAYKGKPDEQGRVEIAYFTFPQYEGRGYATAMAALLTDRALANSEVREVLAHTLPERNASGRVLEKNGFRRIGEVHDPEDGTIWRFRKKK